jgi:hypothetical protein
MNLEAESVTLVSRFSTLFPRGLGAAAITVCGSGCCCDSSVQGDTPPLHAQSQAQTHHSARQAGRQGPTVRQMMATRASIGLEPATFSQSR